MALGLQYDRWELNVASSVLARWTDILVSQWTNEPNLASVDLTTYITTEPVLYSLASFPGRKYMTRFGCRVFIVK